MIYDMLLLKCAAGQRCEWVKYEGDGDGDTSRTSQPYAGSFSVSEGNQHIQRGLK